MKPTPPPSPAAADEEAALWAARLDGSTLSAAQRLALDAWLAGDPERRRLVSRYCQFSADLEQQMPLLAGIKEQSADLRTSPAPARPSPWSRWPLLAGVALSAAAAVAWMFWLVRPRAQFEDITTPAAHRRQLTLADGTRVELNARTRLEVEIDGTVRRARLGAGEAFFQVHKDPARPFIVSTPAGSVRVTGTQFDVRTGPADSLEVTVAEGSVQARPGDTAGAAVTPVALTAGDHFLAQAGTVSVQALSPSALAQSLAWRQGQVIFAATPLRVALERFARYHDRSLTAAPDAADLRVGGRYGLDDLDGFLNALVQVLPVTVHHEADGGVRVDRRPR